MDEARTLDYHTLVKCVVEHAGISEEKATKALEAILAHFDHVLPPPIYKQIKMALTNPMFNTFKGGM